MGFRLLAKRCNNCRLSGYTSKAKLKLFAKRLHVGLRSPDLTTISFAVALQSSAIAFLT